MERLIELLQEYLNSEVFKKDISGNDNIEDIPDVKLTRYFGDRFYCTFRNAEFEILTDTVIGKRYGFIKWLVENDKIKKEGGICPRKDLVQETIIKDRETHEAIGWENKYTEEEQLLMYLSIQENPIEFLISILK